MSKFGKANALREEMTSSLLFVALFSSAGAFTFGFDNAWWGGVLGHPYFNEVFGTLKSTSSKTGVVSHSLTATQQSAGTALGTAGIAIGCMIAGVIAQRYGRKRSFYAVALGSIIGVVIQITSGIGGGRYWQLVAGKIVICASIGVASIGLQLLAPAVILAFGHMLPESPRWLVEKGRHDEARAALSYLRRGKANFDVEVDLAILEEACARERALESSTSWMQCFRGKDGYRTFIVSGVQCLQQGQGIGFMSSYLVIFFFQLGLTNVWQIIIILYVIVVVLTLGGFFVQDFFGRRFLLMSGGAIMAASLIGVGGITAVTPQPVGARANACVALMAAELPSEALRDKTLAIGAFGGYIVGMIIGFVNPYMQNPEYGNLGGKVGFIYGGMSVVSIVFCYCFVPELKGRTLEEVDWMFQKGVPLRQMSTYACEIPQLEETSSDGDAGEKGNFKGAMTQVELA
ncbi:hypothetical protein RQP46_008259 [Phenoliferia psychrophenolica]